MVTQLKANRMMKNFSNNIHIAEDAYNEEDRILLEEMEYFKKHQHKNLGNTKIKPVTVFKEFNLSKSRRVM